MDHFYRIFAKAKTDCGKGKSGKKEKLKGGAQAFFERCFERSRARNLITPGLQSDETLHAQGIGEEKKAEEKKKN